MLLGTHLQRGLASGGHRALRVHGGGGGGGGRRRRREEVYYKTHIVMPTCRHMPVVLGVHRDLEGSKRANLLVACAQKVGHLHM